MTAEQVYTNSYGGILYATNLTFKKIKYTIIYMTNLNSMINIIIIQNALRLYNENQ